MNERNSASSSLARVKEVFLAIVELKDVARDAEIARLCGDDLELRDKVVRMLGRHSVEGGFLEAPAAILVPATGTTSGLEPMPERIGSYAIIDLLGEGGFGSVYRARQEVPIRREVALKVIRRGMDSRSVIARFEAERQTLALLSHPNIARVIDAGQTDDGRPYFVMELIEGVPITRYCDQERLPIERRLRLFMDVCRAVEHAHQKGVIHRDIKPSNVMVQATGGRVDAKVIDFGIAKAIEPMGAGSGTEARLTMEAQLLGTPDYMSPEQVDSELGDVDTRVDIYALGTLLYELLAGVTPLGIARRSGSSLPATMRLIREVDPPRPSQRVANLGDEAAEIAALRATDPRRHRAAVTGDLDWIVMRAIDKERTRRYDSVGSLVADVQRHLANEPILAARPGPWYVTRKFVRRHRVAVASSVLLFISLMVGLGATLLALSRAVSAEAQATLARDDLATVNDFLVEDLLTMARPERGGHKTTIVEAMGNAITLVDRRFATQPILAARVRAVMASAYRALGLRDVALATVEPAERILLEQLGPDDPLTLDVTLIRSSALSDLGRLEEAESVLRDADERARAAFGLDHPATLSVRSHLGELLQKMGKHGEADPILIDAIERLRRLRPDDDASVLTPALSLVASLGAQKRYAEAIPYSEVVLRRAKARHSASDPITLAAANNHATMLTNLGRFAEAEETYRALLATLTESMPEGHWQIALARHSLGVSIERQEGRRAEATELLRTSATDLLAALGPDHAFTERVFGVLANHLRAIQSPEEVAALEQAVGLRLRVAKPDERDSAVRAVRSYLVRAAAVRNESTPVALGNLEAYCQAIVDRGEAPGANALSNLGWACLDRSDSVRAERLLLRADQLARTSSDPDLELLREIADRLATLYDMAGNREEVRKWGAKGSGGR
ncbi:MAG: protein kinase [Phycisphaerae bacterium]|jgi:serine/threonine protein kinase/tetratricopeptide (TPR) repeat protein|nr:protein kinase [Phycisphaerae bacterium]